MKVDQEGVLGPLARARVKEIISPNQGGIILRD